MKSEELLQRLAQDKNPDREREKILLADVLISEEGHVIHLEGMEGGPLPGRRHKTRRKFSK